MTNEGGLVTLVESMKRTSIPVPQERIDKIYKLKLQTPQSKYVGDDCNDCGCVDSDGGGYCWCTE